MQFPVFSRDGGGNPPEAKKQELDRGEHFVLSNGGGGGQHFRSFKYSHTVPVCIICFQTKKFE
jgi:hypothetical protein